MFGALGAVEIVTLHFRSEAKKGGISWMAGAWGVCGKHTGWMEQGRWILRKSVRKRELVRAKVQPELRGKDEEGANSC